MTFPTLSLTGCGVIGDSASSSAVSLHSTVLGEKVGELRAHPYLVTLQRELIESSTLLRSQLHDVPIGISPSAESFVFSHRIEGIVLSRGFLEGVSNEAELSFVISHELCHFAAGHLHERQEESCPSCEEEADKCGLDVVFRAGYDLTSTFAMFARARNADNRARFSHPHWTSRISSATKNAAKYGPSPKGVRERQRYKRFKQWVRRSIP